MARVSSGHKIILNPVISSPHAAFTLRLQCLDDDVNYAEDILCNNVIQKIEVKKKISIRFDLSDLNGSNELTEVSLIEIRRMRESLYFRPSWQLLLDPLSRWHLSIRILLNWIYAKLTNQKSKFQVHIVYFIGQD